MKKEENAKTILISEFFVANLSRCLTNFFHFLFGTFTVVNLSFGLPIETFQCFMLISKLFQKYCSNSTKAFTAVKCINLMFECEKVCRYFLHFPQIFFSALQRKICTKPRAGSEEGAGSKNNEEKVVCAAYYLYVQHKTNGSSFSVTFLRTNITVTFNRRFFFVCIHNFMALFHPFFVMSCFIIFLLSQYHRNRWKRSLCAVFVNLHRVWSSKFFKSRLHFCW